MGEERVDSSSKLFQVPSQGSLTWNCCLAPARVQQVSPENSLTQIPSQREFDTQNCWKMFVNGEHGIS